MVTVLKLKMRTVIIFLFGEYMAVYETKGKRKILSLLAEHPDRQMTAEDIFIALGNDAPGQSSVYRILSSLSSTGQVRRERREGGEGYFYQFAENLGCDKHFHLKCSKCGKTVHLKCAISDELVEHIFKKHGFIIDSGRSVLYGRCVGCEEDTNEGDI